MSDQAQTLREMMRAKYDSAIRQTRVITITSGKGGVGKSNFTLNFALALQSRGVKVLVFDADIGLANIDLLMGVTPTYSLYHLLKREKTIHDIIHKGHYGLEFIAGGSGFHDLVRLSEEELDYFADQVSQLHGHVDYILFDTGAGLSKETLKFILAANETVVVTTPEPTAITDAYAIIKMVHAQGHDDIRFRLIVNRVTDPNEGKQTADKISMVAKKFLNLDIPTLGFVEDDSSVSRAVKKQVPFTVAFPACPASRSIGRIADHFVAAAPTQASAESGVRAFLSKMLKLLK